MEGDQTVKWNYRVVRAGVSVGFRARFRYPPAYRMTWDDSHPLTIEAAAMHIELGGWLVYILPKGPNGGANKGDRCLHVDADCTLTDATMHLKRWAWQAEAGKVGIFVATPVYSIQGDAHEELN